MKILKVLLLTLFTLTASAADPVINDKMYRDITNVKISIPWMFADNLELTLPALQVVDVDGTVKLFSAQVRFNYNGTYDVIFINEEDCFSPPSLACHLLSISPQLN